MQDVFDMSDSLHTLTVQDMVCLTNEMVDWMDSVGAENFCEWPCKLMLVEIERLQNISVRDIEETKNQYCTIFHTLEQARKQMVSEDTNDERAMSKILFNLNRCRTLVGAAFLAIQPLCHMMHVTVAQDTDNTSNAPILQMCSSSDKEKLTDCQKLIRHLLQVCFLRPYKKYDGHVYEQFGKDSHYWKKKFSIKDFIHTECSYENSEEHWKLMSSNAGNVTFLEEQLNIGCNDNHFPVLERNRNVWAFRNGVYDGKNDKFYSFETDTINIIDGEDILPISQLSQRVVAAKLFENVDCTYYPELKGDFSSGDWMKIPTPAHDQILNYQGFEEEVQRCIWSMGCGRMQYNIHEVQNHQIICFLVGMAGTGKSIWIDAINHMYEPEDIGVISNTGQAIFCLDGLEKKYIWHMSEVTSKLNLCQAKFQQLVSGESISIDRKNKQSVVKLWSAPGIMAGNETPSYSDNSGSIARRTMAVRFEKTLDKEHLDTSLKEKLFQGVAQMIIKGNRAFRAMNSQYGDAGFATFAPEYFSYTQAIMKASTNALVSFLGSSRVRYDKKEEYVREREFKEAFYSFCKENGHDPPKWTPDYYQGPLAGKKITVGKNNTGKEERLPWPKLVERTSMDGVAMVKGNRSHSKFFHGCRLQKEFEVEEEEE